MLIPKGRENRWMSKKRVTHKECQNGKLTSESQKREKTSEYKKKWEIKVGNVKKKERKVNNCDNKWMSKLVGGKMKEKKWEKNFLKCINRE